MKKLLLIPFVFLLLAKNALSQEALYTLKFQQITLAKALDSLEKISNTRIFYSPDKVNANMHVNANFQQQSLSAIIKALIPNPNLILISKPGQLIIQIKELKKYTWSGYVKEKGSLENLIAVNIVSNNQFYGTQTNAYGFFSITLPEGNYQFNVSYIGYATKTIKLSITENLSEDILLEPESNLNEVVITESNDEQSKPMHKLEVPLEKLEQMPAFLGESDLIKYLNLLPGVGKGNEANQGMFIRGGTPDQNLVMVDDATLYSSFHLFGFYSLFSGSELRSAELSKNGFSARNGGRTSSVLNLSLKDGNRKRWEGDFGVGLLASHVQVNGPVIKDKSSMLLSVRRTYLDAFTTAFMDETERAGYYYLDVHTKVNFDLNAKNRIYFSMYTGQDQFTSYSASGEAKDQSKVRWGNDALSFRWSSQLSNKLFLNTSVFHTGYISRISFESVSGSGSSKISLNTSIKDYGIKSDLDYLLNAKHWIKGGAALTKHFFTPNVSRALDQTTGIANIDNSLKIEAFELGVYAEDNIRFNQKWSGTFGIRLSNFLAQNKNYVVPEPRIYLQYLPSKKWSYNLSYTHMAQFVNLISTGWIGLPSEIWIPVSENIKPQVARQLSLGYSTKITPHLSWGQEFFGKYSSNVTAYREGISMMYLIFSNTGSDNLTYYDKLLVQGQMFSYGTEVMLKYAKGKIETWLAYSLSKTNQQFNEINHGNWFTALHDRRHDFSAAFVYLFNKKWTGSAAWMYGSGFMMSLPEANFNLNPHIPQDPNGFNLGYEQTMAAQFYKTKNTIRAAAYHHLDISLKYRWEGKKGSHFLGLNIYNLYNRANPFFYSIDYVESTGKNALIMNSFIPIVPSINYKYAF